MPEVPGCLQWVILRQGKNIWRVLVVGLRFWPRFGVNGDKLFDGDVGVVARILVSVWIRRVEFVTLGWFAEMKGREKGRTDGVVYLAWKCPERCS